MKQKIVVIVSVVAFFLCMILLIGFLLDLGFDALLEWLFTSEIKDGFTEDLVDEIRQNGGISIPADAEFLYGKRYSGEDYSTVIGFYVPCPPETADPAVFVQSALLLQPKAWREDAPSQIGFHASEENLPDLIGRFALTSESHYAWLDYSGPANGKLYIRLYFSTV